MPRRPDYSTHGTPYFRGWIEDPGFVFADSGDADPLGARNRAQLNADRAAQASAEERERQRQHELDLLAREQQGTRNRDLLDAYLRQGLQANELNAAAQSQSMHLQQREGESVRGAQQDYFNSLLRAAEGEEERAMRDRQFQQTGEQGAYEFERRSAQQDEQFRREEERRAFEFEENRRPSDRDRFDADRRMAEMRAAQEFQAQEMGARFNLEAQLQQQQLTQAEKMRLQRMQQAVSAVQADLDAGKIDAEIANDAMMQLRTGISPLQIRQANENALRTRQQQQLLYAQTIQEMQLTQMKADFDAKTFQERVGTYTDPETGQKLRFYQSQQGKYEFLPDKGAEMEAKRQEAQMKRQEAKEKAADRLRERQYADEDRAVKHWQDRWADAERVIDAEFKKKAVMKDPDSPTTKFIPDQDALTALEKTRPTLRAEILKQWGLPDNPQAVVEPIRQRYAAMPPESMESPATPTIPADEWEQYRQPGGGYRIPAQHGFSPSQVGGAATGAGEAAMGAAPPPTPAAPPEPPRQASAPIRDAVMHEFGDLEKRFPSGQESQWVASAKAIFEKYGSIDAMPTEARVQFMGLLTTLKERLGK